MRALVVYESVYGNTHAIADHIGSGLAARYEVSIAQASHVTAEDIAGCDLLVVGSPTHVHGLPSEKTRGMAERSADKPTANPDLEADAMASGVREWLEEVGPLTGKPAAAFDTRFDGPSALTGRASKNIARHLHRKGAQVLVDPESFIVDKQNRLEPQEAERAEAWAASLVVHPQV